MGEIQYIQIYFSYIVQHVVPKGNQIILIQYYQYKFL